MPRPLLTPRKDLVPIAQEAGWAPGPVWTGAENLAPHRDSIPDRPARSQLLYQLCCPAPHCRMEWVKYTGINYFNVIAKNILFLVNRAIPSVVMVTNEAQCTGNVELITLPV